MRKYQIIRDISPKIFIIHDIRGVYGDSLNENIAYTIGKSYGTYIAKNGYDKCVIGHDI